MENDLPAKRHLTTIASWLALVFALGCLGYIAWYIPSDRRVYAQIFSDFGMELPPATKFMMTIPDAAFPTVAAILGCVLVGIQWFTRMKSGALIVHMLAIVLCCMALVAYRESLFHPLSSLLRTASGVPAG